MSARWKAVVRKREGRLDGGRVSRRAALQLRAAFGRRLLQLRGRRGWSQELLAGGAARDRGAVAPPGLQALLGMEESTPMGSARDWEGPAGSDTADEPRESAVGCAEDPRRAVEARPDRLAGDGVEVHCPWP